MQLTKAHLAQLKRALAHRTAPPTLWQMWLFSWRKNLVILGLYGGAAWFTWSTGSSWLTAFLLGYLLAVLIRDVQWLIVHKRFWPVSSAVTDWQKVEQLINENERPAT